MAKSVTPFLMFARGAEEAMNFYCAQFEDAEILSIERYGKDGPGPEGSVYKSMLRILGQKVMCFDTPVKHAFDFTPSFSFFVECETEAELDRLFVSLSDGGGVMMPPGDYGFSSKFAWLADRWGVSWQLNLAA
ncbi:MAG: VOC family protein [Pseudomonadota bacterium]|nr:VOC family protein [Pseudomonadota bacterium]